MSTTSTQLQLLPAEVPIDVWRIIGSFSSLSALMNLAQTCQFLFLSRDDMILGYAQTEQQRMGLTPESPFTFRSVHVLKSYVITAWKKLASVRLREVKTSLMNQPLVLYVSLNPLTKQLTNLIATKEHGKFCTIDPSHRSRKWFKNPKDKTSFLCHLCFPKVLVDKQTAEGRVCSRDRSHRARKWFKNPNDRTSYLCNDCFMVFKINHKRKAPEPKKS